MTAWANDEIPFVIAGSPASHSREKFKELLNLIILVLRDKLGGDSYDQVVYGEVWHIVNKIVIKGATRTGCAGRQDLVDLFKEIIKLPNASRYENFADIEAAVSERIGVVL